MNSKQMQFFELAVIKLRTYNEISEEIGIDRKFFRQWWSEYKTEREQLAKIRQLWKRKCPQIDVWDFYSWHKTENHECFYCHITEDEINKLIESRQIHTKRLPTRGRKLEIERLQPNKEYNDLMNLRYCCYWCNNAKSDEFSEDEFKAIGNSIGAIWKDRLSKKGPICK
jgi:5-methylcytosine-specific restriction endonuclease McrA